MEKTLTIIKWLFILLVVFGLAFFFYVAVKLAEPATTTSHPQDFEVSRGERAGQIVRRLAEQKFVSSKLLLQIYLRVTRKEDDLEAGSYTLDSNMTIPEIVKILSEGQVKQTGKRMTIIEGWDVADIGVELEAEGITSKKEFLRFVEQPPVDLASEFEFLVAKPGGASLEGFLFPDTYILKPGSDARTVTRKFLQGFDLKVGGELIEEIRKQKHSLYEVITLASIVEREVGRNVKKGTVLTADDKAQVARERRIVAGIFWKRLTLGMALQSDATVTYVTGSKSARATLDEIQINSPYNTYKYRGLPPTPIANPSLDSIQAAVQPQETDYLYFVTAPDGTAYFARTLEEHNQNRARYLD